jgi:hypothetical protein
MQPRELSGYVVIWSAVDSWLNMLSSARPPPGDFWAMSFATVRLAPTSSLASDLGTVLAEHVAERINVVAPERIPLTHLCTSYRLEQP